MAFHEFRWGCLVDFRGEREKRERVVNVIVDPETNATN
jgi:hypothetical protein